MGIGGRAATGKKPARNFNKNKKMYALVEG
jgi:hypothetical protein